MSSDQVVLYDETFKNTGIIILNRPKALNALNLPMMQSLLPKLEQWEGEKSLVIIKGVDGRAFSAGGDILSVFYQSDLGRRCLKMMYTIIRMTETYKIPYIALIDGIVMGGGAALSVVAKFRIATERSIFGLPETAIGFIPDCGMSYFLSRLDGNLGFYLGLTGNRFKGIDVLHVGVATHYVESRKLPELEKELVNCGNENDIHNVLQKFAVSDKAEFSLKPHLDKINECFGRTTVEEIFAKLEENGTEWAIATLKTLKMMSPTSLKITMRALQNGSKMSLWDCLQMEYRVGCICMENNDFREGVRAALIDKDKKPKWNPGSLEDVTDEIVDNFFAKRSVDWELSTESNHKL